MATRRARIAYLVQAFKQPEQVNLLLGQLLADGDVYVHLDAKSVKTMAPRLLRHPRLRVVGKSLDVRWGDISSVDCSLLMFREALASGRTYDFFVLRSGQDLVVREGFARFLADYRGRSLLSARPISRGERFSALADLRWPRFARSVYDSAHPYRMARSVLLRLWGLGLRPLANPDRLPARFQLFHGSAWFCLAREHVSFVLRYLLANPWFHRAFQNALVPDEWFFQTLLLNSEHAAEIVNRPTLFQRWGTTRRERNHPVVLTARDIPEIEQSGEYFARKFDLRIDPEVVDYFVARSASAVASEKRVVEGSVRMRRLT
ncbi:MAG: beta-1,6-N-acetylglucosaminyltransferase [Myxococcales bacterium]